MQSMSLITSNIGTFQKMVKKSHQHICHLIHTNSWLQIVLRHFENYMLDKSHHVYHVWFKRLIEDFMQFEVQIECLNKIERLRYLEKKNQKRKPSMYIKLV